MDNGQSRSLGREVDGVCGWEADYSSSERSFLVDRNVKQRPEVSLSL
jgi:hypothetical protein